MSEMTTHRRNWRHAGTGTLVSTLANQSLAAVPVAAVAVFAAIQSYSHIEALALAQHQSLADARMLPFSVDFLIVAGSVVVLAGYWLGWLGIVAGVMATLFANVESGLPFGPLSATVAAWPAVAFSVASFILERWLKRQSEPAAEATPETITEATAEATEEPAGEAAPVPSPTLPEESAEMPAEVALEVPPSVPEERPTQRPAKEPRPRAVRISEDAEAKRARAEYRKSLSQGQPFSDRALGAKFGRSRTWGANRIAEVEEGPALTAQAR